MNRTQLEHIIRAASRISDDSEIVVIGSQSIHAQQIRLPPIAYISQEADVYPRNYPEREDDIDFRPRPSGRQLDANRCKLSQNPLSFPASENASLQ